MQALRELNLQEIEQIESISWWHRIPVGRDPQGKILFTPGICHHGPDGDDYASKRFGLPKSFSSLTVADIGGWDGYFAFEAESRGAREVTIFEAPRQEGGNWGGSRGFLCAKELLQSRVDYVLDNLYNLPENRHFDVTLFFGLLYHLKTPILALEKLYRITKGGGYSLIETALAPASWVSEEAPAWIFLQVLMGILAITFTLPFVLFRRRSFLWAIPKCTPSTTMEFAAQ